MHNRFPYLHDQHLTDYEGTQTWWYGGYCIKSKYDVLPWVLKFQGFFYSKSRFFKGCLIPPEDVVIEAAHYVTKQDSLSLTNFALMDEDDEEEFTDHKSDGNTNVLTSISKCS